MLGLGFQHDHVADGIERLVFDGGQPAVAGFAGLELGDFVHDVLPCPGGSGRVARLPIDARQMAAECRGFLVFVLGRDEPKGFVLVAGLEGFLFAGGVVLVVINTPRAKEYAVSLFHVIFHFMTMNQLDLTPLASSGRVRFEL
jgi:hypothetical protein